MRFRIEQQTKMGCVNQNAPYRLYLLDTVLVVKRPVLYTRLDWTWRDGTEYSLTFPNLASVLGGRSWDLISGERTICSGQLVLPSLREGMFRVKRPHQEWKFRGTVIISESRGCMTTQLRQRDGRRLALWHPRRFGWGAEVWQGVWRNSLPEGDVPVILGMILAQVHTHKYEPVGD